MGWNWKWPAFSFKIMLVLDDIVLLWTGTMVMATHTDHRQPVKQSILTQLLCCWCATWLNNRVTEQHASCHVFSLFEPYRGPAEIAMLVQPQQVWNADSVSGSIGNSTPGLFMCYSSRQMSSPVYICAAHCSSQSSRITQGEGKSERDSRERQSWGGEQSGAAWRG